MWLNNTSPPHSPCCTCSWSLTTYSKLCGPLFSFLLHGLLLPWLEDRGTSPHFFVYSTASSFPAAQAFTAVVKTVGVTAEPYIIDLLPSVLERLSDKVSGGNTEKTLSE